LNRKTPRRAEKSAIVSAQSINAAKQSASVRNASRNDAFHAAALGAGGRDNGTPGLPSSDGANYYAAYVIDPEGHRIEAYCGQAVS
jgi:hypothetical protein